MAIQKITQKTREFGSKFKEQVSTAILTALGLVIALAWKDVIFDVIAKINPTQSNIFISAVLVTLFAIIGMAIISKWAKKPTQSKLS